MSSLPAHDMGPAANALRRDVRGWLATHWTPERRAEHLRKPFKEQQDEWLPAIRRGERTFALGYSEPEAGSDLAALRTRAVREGDDLVVNGQKLWSTGADKAEYMWLAVRT